MTQLKDLHNKYNKFPEYKNFYLNYQFNSTDKEWEFRGYRCVKCDRLLHRNVNGVPSHQKSCKEINKTRVYKTVEIDPTAKVVDVRGQIWKPIDFNQN